MNRMRNFWGYLSLGDMFHYLKVNRHVTISHVYRRQFDNVKRIFKVVEDLQGSVIQNIKNLFLLSEDLAK